VFAKAHMPKLPSPTLHMRTWNVVRRSLFVLEERIKTGRKAVLVLATDARQSDSRERWRRMKRRAAKKSP